MSESENDETKSREAGEDFDINAVVQAVLREAYLQSSEDLHDYADKVRYFNEKKKAIRRYLREARRLKADVLSNARQQRIDLCGGDESNLRELEKLFNQHAHAYEGGDIGYELCLPASVPPEGVDSIEKLEAVISEWEDKLNSVGDDAQLANIDLQNMLQKQQQTMQMMSNISKQLHDTAMAVIRKLGG